MRFNLKALIYLLVTIYTLSATAAWAQDLKSRMSARLPKINALKASGVAGENNNGYLSMRKQLADKKALVDAENADRRKAYQIIAKQQGASAEHVGKRRAMQIAKKAKPGTWLQNAQGKWYRK